MLSTRMYHCKCSPMRWHGFLRANPLRCVLQKAMRHDATCFIAIVALRFMPRRGAGGPISNSSRSLGRIPAVTRPSPSSPRLGSQRGVQNGALANRDYLTMQRVMQSVTQHLTTEKQVKNVKSSCIECPAWNPSRRSEHASPSPRQGRKIPCYVLSHALFVSIKLGWSSHSTSYFNGFPPRTMNCL